MVKGCSFALSKAIVNDNLFDCYRFSVLTDGTTNPLSDLNVSGLYNQRKTGAP